MDPISSNDRIVANVKKDEFVPFIDSNGNHDGDVLKVNPNNKPGYGFHVYRMPPGHTTTAHEHIGDEEFLILEGEIVDHDGFKYGPGDIVWLRSGTKHHSYSEKGALIAVYLQADAGV